VACYERACQQRILSSDLSQIARCLQASTSVGKPTPEMPPISLKPCNAAKTHMHTCTDVTAAFCPACTCVCGMVLADPCSGYSKRHKMHRLRSFWWQLLCTLASMLHLLRDTQNGCVLACMRARTLPPLDHAPICQHRCPAPSPAHHC